MMNIRNTPRRCWYATKNNTPWLCRPTNQMNKETNIAIKLSNPKKEADYSLKISSAVDMTCKRLRKYKTLF